MTDGTAPHGASVHPVTAMAVRRLPGMSGDARLTSGRPPPVAVRNLCMLGAGAEDAGALQRRRRAALRIPGKGAGAATPVRSAAASRRGMPVHRPISAVRHDRRVASRESPVDRGRRRARELLVDIGREAMNARLGAGLSQDSVARAARTSRSSMSRIEGGRAPRVSVERVSNVLVAVGMDLALRAYPAGPPVRDAAHIRLLARFRERIGPGWRWRPEVPIGAPGELRAWDGVLVRDGCVVAIEAETRLRDVQALLRRLAVKRRDGARPNASCWWWPTRGRTGRSCASLGSSSWPHSRPTPGLPGRRSPPASRLRRMR